MDFGKTTLPTRITIGRLVAAPIFLVLFGLAAPFRGKGDLLKDLDPILMGAALVLLLLQEASDIVDGFVARRRGEVSDLGRLLDPLADTLSHMGAFFLLMEIGLVPVWLIVVMYYREAMVSTLRVLAAKNGIVVAARISGKLKAVCQGGAVNVLIMLMLAAHYEPRVPVYLIAEVFSWILGAVTLYSLVDYFVAIRGMSRPKAS